jgi:hypothetical protein
MCQIDSLSICHCNVSCNFQHTISLFFYLCRYHVVLLSTITQTQRKEIMLPFRKSTSLTNGVSSHNVRKPEIFYVHIQLCNAILHKGADV